MNSSTITLNRYRILAHDVIILLVIYFLPSLAHFAPFPLVMLEPMRALLFVGFVLSYNKWNAYILALTIPLFSSLVTGHPVFFKATLISTELLVHLTLFIILFNKYKRQIVVIF